MRLIPYFARNPLEGQRETATGLLLFLLCSLPFFVPIHLPPVPSFHSEWLAGALGLVLATVSFFNRSTSALTFPQIAILPGVLIGTIVCQQLGGQNYHYQQALMYCAYLVFGLTLVVTGAELVSRYGIAHVHGAMAAGFAAGSLAQCVSGILQLQGITLWGFAPLLHGRGIYGNLAQQNNLADYLWLGLISIGYLFGTKRIGWLLLLAAAVPLGITAAYTSSRSAILYPLAILALSALIKVRVGHTGALRIIKGLRAISAIALLCLAIPQWISPPVAQSATTGIERLVSSAVEGKSASVRLQLLAVALQATAEHPLTGSGVGSVPLQSLRHGDVVTGSGFGVAEHFHNVIANWLVEFGIPVALLACFLLWRWLRAVLRETLLPEQLLGLFLLIIIGLHSLLEYPLWYSFFLAPVALILGALDPRTKTIELSRVTSLGATGGMLLAGLLLVNLWQDHARLTRIYLLPPSGPQAEQIWKSQVDDLLLLHRESLLSPHINGMLIVTADIDRQQLENKQHVCEAALHFSPAPAVIFKCAALYVLAGRVDDGLDLARMGRRGFPADAQSALTELRTKVLELPELAILEAEWARQ
jgi:O-antigen ligase